METYKDITGSKKFIGNQPITFNKLTYDNTKKYYVTHKLDGVRRLLIIENETGELIDNKMNISHFRLPKRKILNKTILDGELFEKKFYAFDILFLGGKDLRKLNLSERIIKLEEVNKILKSRKVLVKEYLSPYKASVCQNFHNVKHDYKKNMLDGTVDGVIFTPDTGYNEGRPLKWKPESLLSIDFKIRKKDNNEIELLNHDGKIFTPYGKYKHVGIVKITKEQYKNYDDGVVVEFIFKNGKFIPIRERRDKINSNHISVIISNFKTILNPPNMKKLLCL